MVVNCEGILIRFTPWKHGHDDGRLDAISLVSLNDEYDIYINYDQSSRPDDPTTWC